jgi:hypothetical protein
MEPAFAMDVMKTVATARALGLDVSEQLHGCLIDWPVADSIVSKYIDWHGGEPWPRPFDETNVVRLRR